MVTMDQSTWNLLFTWMTGRQCFIPEGCNPPAVGVLVYLFILLAALIALWKRQELMERVSSL